jgi:hypothetical protein
MIAEEQAVQERVAREMASKDYTAKVLAERLATEARDKSYESEQRKAEEGEIRRAEAHAVSVRAELQRK